ncbi:MAG: DegT/DnrJ/EryC1/StrS family aminotransferase [Phycisphaerales bacterium]|jgi:dTDP-4-amino-4,6-dideoxygalactose transaminase|nr:DegT/DnrJ/EryC1/StrS family aminotransferase [Phycisphaerales bacterium]MBT7171785.1 DegT/DnrJ/EryC1/StrS family aminotransferase [Phycisphaerales bacterium]
MKPFDEPIFVTRPALPPLEEFAEGLKEIWDNRWLTNSGPVHQRYQARLGEFLQAENVSLYSNGTLALQQALEAFDLPPGSEVITTPFTFVATAHAIVSAGLTPVFVDIEPTYFNLDPVKVEQAITPKTSAILPVHVFGNPCDIPAFEALAIKHDLKLIFDAAHAFGVEVASQPIGNFGDVSMFSLHATKLYHSVEGGVLVLRDPAICEWADLRKNFGFQGETQVAIVGTNAKMSEIHALMGLQLLDQVGDLIESRRAAVDCYRECLADVKGITLPAAPASSVRSNHAYMPILVDQAQFGLSRDGLYDALKDYNVFSRRYFYPLLTEFACYREIETRGELPVATHIAEQVLCLPLYPDLGREAIRQIVEIIQSLS